MIPEIRLSTTAVFGPFKWPIKQREKPLLGYHMGGVAISDGSQGRELKLWTVEYDKETGDVYVYAPGTPSTVLFTAADVEELDLAFDQNMRPVVAYVQAGQGKYYWYDPTIENYTHTSLPSGSITPRCCVDDTRREFANISDIVIAYLRSGTLYVRLQSERYLTEHSMQTGLGADARLVDVGMNEKLRLQWLLSGANVVGGGLAVFDPFLADIVRALCLRGGITPDAINVQELYDTQVIGYKCNTDDGLNKRIDALREMFIFDKSEHDKAIFFPRRGREVTARIPYSDLVADDPSALKVTRIQEIELPKTVTVNHLDPAGAFANNKQTARRRSNLVKAKKEKVYESEIVLTADQGMTAAVIKLKVFWHEQQTFKFATTIKYSYVVETDVVEVEDKNGVWHRIRLTERNENNPVIDFEGVQDAGQDVYSTLGVGLSLPPPVSTTPGEVGDTRLEILNIPCLRDQDDELGLYGAVCGTSSGWHGSQILVSSDGGVNYAEALTTDVPATIGDTLTDLADEVSAEYPADQSFDVLTNFALESISFETLLQNGNRCVVGDEILQFQTATLIGMVDGQYHYRCSDLVRGRYATEVEAWATGTRFILLDSSVFFIQTQQWMLGREINIKPVSIGATEDETTIIAYDFDEGVSQREFPVHDVESTRDGSNNVTVTFIGRGRLGIDTDPRNGKYFAGYRVKFSNGHTIDTLNMTATYSSAPTSITVQVCALNTITGEGPYSTAIAT